MTRRFQISTSHQRIAVVSHAVETGKAKSAAALPFGYDGVHPVENEARRARERATAQAGARDDAVDLAPQRQDRERRERDERDDRERHARGEQQREDECETEQQSERGDEGSGAELAGLLAQHLVEDARRRVDPDARIGRERKLRGGGGEERSSPVRLRRQPVACAHPPAPPPTRSGAGGRRRTGSGRVRPTSPKRTLNDAASNVRKAIVTSESVASACSSLPCGSDERRQHPSASEDQRHQPAADRDRIEMSTRRRPHAGGEQRTLPRPLPRRRRGGCRTSPRPRGSPRPRARRRRARRVDGARRAACRIPPSSSRRMPISCARIASGRTTTSTANCVLARTARQSAATARRSRLGLGSAIGELQTEDRPQERGVRRGLGHQEAGEHHPGNEDGEPRSGERPGAREHLAAEEIHREDRADHQERVQHVRGTERLGRRERAVERRDEQRIELVVDRDRGAVHLGQRRARVRDRGRELRVQELVGHHRPVLDPPREPDRDRGTDSEPEHESAAAATAEGCERIHGVTRGLTRWTVVTLEVEHEVEARDPTAVHHAPTGHQALAACRCRRPGCRSRRGRRAASSAPSAAVPAP